MSEKEKYSGRLFSYILPLMLFLLLTLVLFPEYVTGKMVPFGRDDAITYQPQRYFFTESLKSGNLPLWCPNIGLGHPMAAEGQNALFHPFTFLFFIFPFYKAYSLSVVLCYPLFAFFLYLLCLEYGLKREGSLLCSILVTFAGAFLLWQGHYAIISTLLWLPLFLMFLIRACRDGKLIDIALASLFHVLMIFSGAAQFTYAGTIFAFIFLLTIGNGGNRFGFATVMRTLIPAVLLSCLLGAVQLIPLYELTMHSQRSGVLFDPNTGSLNLRTSSAIGSSIMYTPNEILTGGTALYGSVGILGTLLALFGYFHADEKIRRIIPLIIFIVFAFGGWTTLGLFREAGRMLFFTALIIGLYAGFGFDTFLSVHSYEKKFKLSFICAAITLVLLTLLSADFFPVSSFSDYIFLLIPSILAIIILRFLKFPAEKSHWVVTSFVILVSLAGSAFLLHLKTSETAYDAKQLYKTPGVADFFDNQDTKGRVWISLANADRKTIDFHENVYGPRALMYGLETTDHETPLFINGVMHFERMLMSSLIAGIERDSEIPPRADILAGLEYIAVNQDISGENPFFDELYSLENVPLREMDDNSPPQLVGKLAGYRGNAFFIFPEKVSFISENEPLSIDGFYPTESSKVPALVISGPERKINSTPGETSTVVYHPDTDPDRLLIEYSAPPGSFLFISQTHYPGWKAYMDGEEIPLYKTYGLFNGVIVDKPNGTVELRYEPASWKIGALLSLAGLLIFVVIIVSGIRVGYFSRTATAAA